MHSVPKLIRIHRYTGFLRYLSDIFEYFILLLFKLNRVTKIKRSLF